jgi:hypothetical protein
MAMVLMSSRSMFGVLRWWPDEQRCVNKAFLASSWHMSRGNQTTTTDGTLQQNTGHATNATEARSTKYEL